MEHYSLPRELSSSFLRKKVHHLEEKLLALSELKLFEELHIFDVPIDHYGENFIHTTRCGDSNTEILVLLHGYGGSNVLYYPMLKDLSKRFKVYCIDMLGLGLSSRPEFKLETTEECIAFFVESLEKWRLAIGIQEPFCLGGHSFGGYIAAQYAIKYQKNVKKLLMLSPCGITKPRDDPSMEELMKKVGFFRRQLMKLFMKFWDEKLTPTKFLENHPWIFAWALKRYVKNRFSLPDEIASILYEYLQETFKLPESSEKAIHYILKPPRARAQIPLEDLLVTELEIPVTIFYGDRDWMDTTGAKAIYESGKKANFSLKYIPNSGHQITMENPKEMSKALLEEPL